MNILIVDDQPTVVEGVLAGVNWERLHISEQYKAYNIFQAKELIQSHEINLMLCDIEMPMGSGLELFEWVQDQKKYDIKCIFLTSHSDFSYARQAVHLQGFDYLLQPVSYQQIEETLKKAIDKINIEKLVRDYSSYGRAIKKKEKDVQKSILRDYLLGINTNVCEIKDSLSTLSLSINESDLFDLVLIQVLDMQDKEWNDNLLMYAIENVADESFCKSLIKSFMIQIDARHMIVVRVAKEEGKEEFQKRQMKFITLIDELLQVKIALYDRIGILFMQLPAAQKELMQYTKKNVLSRSGIYDLSKSEDETQGMNYSRPDLNKWSCFMQEGYFDMLQQEAFEYLDHQTKLGHMNISLLKQFHQDYIYLFFDALKKTGGRNEAMFPIKSQIENQENEKSQYKVDEITNENDMSDYNYDALMNSYTSVDRMKSLITFSTNYLKGIQNNEDVSESRMEEIMNYIHNNIQKNITRKDVAEAVYLNPEYLSRLFRKEKGVKLSDYILEEKMAIAKHLLETTKFSVSIVASKVGYTNFSHFAQCFKRLYGISPSELNRNK